jgi:hypothetical protein
MANQPYSLRGKGEGDRSNVFKAFLDQLDEVVGPVYATLIANFLRTHHLSRGSEPTNIHAQLLTTNGIHTVSDRNAMYIAMHWTEPLKGEHFPVCAVFKVCLNMTINLIIHLGANLNECSPSQPLQAEYHWFAYDDPVHLNDILLVGGRHLGLFPAVDGSEIKLILFCDGYTLLSEVFH